MAEAARTGEFPQSKCRCRVERAARAIVHTRTARTGNSGSSSPGGSRNNGHPKTRRSVLGDIDRATSNFSSHLRRSHSSGDTEGEEEAVAAALSDIGGAAGRSAGRDVDVYDGVGGRGVAASAGTRGGVWEYDGVGRWEYGRVSATASSIGRRASFARSLGPNDCADSKT